MSKEATQYAKVVEIANRFHNPHFDLTASEGREFIMEGTLLRQSSKKWKQVKRECFLFNDVFVFSDKLKKDKAGKLEMKQVVDLNTAVLDDRTQGKTSMKNCVCITTPEREFVVSAASAEERDEWVSAIGKCITDLKLAKGEMPAAGEHAVHLGTIFSAVVLNNFDEMPKIMKQKSFNIDDKDASGNTALHLAVENGYEEATALLLEAGADMSIYNQEGYPVLHLACIEGQLGIVQKLLEVKADVKQFDERKDGVVYLTITKGVQNGAKIVEMLVKAGADFRSTFNEGKSLLHLAAEHNDSPTISLLVKLGLPLTAECDHGRSPLHYAAQSNSLAACETLLGEGTGPNVRDQNLNTPLHLSRSSQMGVILVKHGARLELKNVHDLPASSFFDKDAKNLIHVNTAREAWAALKTVERDEELCTDKSEWVKDNLSDVCQLCLDSFTMTRRRHHCRRCGSLVCGACSTKKFKHTPVDSLKSKSPKVEKERACDSCYNHLCYKAVQRREVEAKIRAATANEKAHQRQKDFEDESKERMSRIKGMENGNKNIANRIRDKDAASKASATADVMNQNKDILNQNIDTLKRVEDNAAKLEDGGADFAKMCAQLNKK